MGIRNAGMEELARLERKPAPDVIPVLADANSATWILKLRVGEDLTLENESGQPVRLRLAGLLEGSFFQSELLASRAHLLRHFPSLARRSFFLIDAPPASVAGAAQALADHAQHCLGELPVAFEQRQEIPPLEDEKGAVGGGGGVRGAKPAVEQGERRLARAILERLAGAAVGALGRVGELGLHQLDRVRQPVREVADRYGHFGAAGLRAQLRDHRGRDVHAVDADAARGERQRDATGADGELEHRAAAGQTFEKRDGRVLVNELAPRTHNSGHLTIDACATSQFEQQLRAVCGLPLGATDLVRPAAMANLLGDLWQDGEPRWADALARPGIRLHLYGKRQAKPGRKMGHLTALAETPDDAVALVRDARAALTGSHVRA